MLTEGGLKVRVQQLACLLTLLMALVFVSTLEPGDGLVQPVTRRMARYSETALRDCIAALLLPVLLPLQPLSFDTQGGFKDVGQATELRHCGDLGVDLFWRGRGRQTEGVRVSR